MKAIERYYSPRQLEALLPLKARTLIEKARAGEFGSGVVFIPAAKSSGSGVAVVSVNRGDWMIPASGVNAWLERHQVRVADTESVAARTVGELRRKVAMSSE